MSIGRALVVRGDARALPLPDASVDLVVTSPPSNADAVQLLGSLEQCFQPFREVGSTRRGVPARGPHFQVGLRDQHPSRSEPKVRHVAKSNRLNYRRVALSQPPCGLRHGDHRLGWIDRRQGEPATLTRRVHLYDLQGVERLFAFYPQVRKQLLEHTTGSGTMDLPGQQWPAAGSRRLGVVSVPPEQQMQQVQGLWRHLLDRDARRVDRLGCIAAHPCCVRVAVHTDPPVRVDNTGRIGQIGWC